MFKHFASTRVSFVPRNRTSYVNNNIAPGYPEQSQSLIYNSVKSVNSIPMTESTILPNNGIYSVAKNLSQRKFTFNSNQTQAPLPDQHNFDRSTKTNNKQNNSQDYRPFSCKQNLILFLTVLLAFLILMTFVLSYVLIYFLTQRVTLLTQLTQNYMSVVSSSKYYCGGISSYTNWNGIASYNATVGMTIDTSYCQFSSTPLYFTSVGGLNDQFNLASYNAIYFATNKSFTIFANSLFGYNAVYMLSEANSNQWNVNWLGVTY